MEVRAAGGAVQRRCGVGRRLQRARVRLCFTSWIVDLAFSARMGMGRRPKHVSTLTLRSTTRGHPALSLVPFVTAVTPPHPCFTRLMQLLGARLLKTKILLALGLIYNPIQLGAADELAAPSRDAPVPRLPGNRVILAAHQGFLSAERESDSLIAADHCALDLRARTRSAASSSVSVEEGEWRPCPLVSLDV